MFLARTGSVQDWRSINRVRSGMGRVVILSSSFAKADSVWVWWFDLPDRGC